MSSSEEKTQPPTEQKLKKAREKGNVVTSKDTLASVTTLVVLLYIFMRRNQIGRDLASLFEISPDPDLDFALILAGKTEIIFDVMAGILLPLIALVLSIGILLGMAISGGPLFSTHPLKPEFKKIDPIGGFKKIFGRKALMTFLMHFIRVGILMTVLAFSYWYSIERLIPAPRCGLGCELEGFEEIVIPLVITITAFLTLFAGFDYMVQRSEFMREQKMSMSELKREFKDREGDPHLKGQMKSDQRDMVERPTGLNQASVIIHDAPRIAIGVRYVDGETPAPLVVVKATGGDACQKLLSRSPVHVAHDAEVIENIGKVPVGEYIVEEEVVMSLVPHLQAAVQK